MNADHCNRNPSKVGIFCYLGEIMDRFTKRVRKSQVEKMLSQCNEVYRHERGSERPLYLTATLKKCYNPSTETKMWMVGRNFGMPPRVLGQTLAESFSKLCPF